MSTTLSTTAPSPDLSTFDALKAAVRIFSRYNFDLGGAEKSHDGTFYDPWNSLYSLEEVL